MKHERKRQYGNIVPRSDPLALRTSEAPEVAMQGVYRLRMLSSSVASSCLTLHEQARDHEYGGITQPIN